MIAKEARMQVDRFYSKEDLDEFTAVFFHFLMFFIFLGGLKELFCFFLLAPFSLAAVPTLTLHRFSVLYPRVLVNTSRV